MKLKILLLVLSIGTVSLNALCQQTGEKRFQCDFSNRELIEVFNQLERQYQPFKFFYKPEVLQNKKFTCHTASNSMEDLLQKLLDGSGVFYNVYGGVYFIVHDQPNLYMAFAKKPEELHVLELKGMVYQPDSETPVANASVYNEKLGIGATTNSKGAFAIQLPPGQHILTVTSISYSTQYQFADVPKDQFVKIVMQDGAIELKEFEIYDEKSNKEVVSHAMGMEKINMKEIEELPRLLGEAEVIQSVLLMTGVTSVGEGATGFNVRGGSIDQNLILFDDSEVFNPSHLYGLLSVFNPDVVKKVTLHKGSIPSSLGGRASSVLEVFSKDGDLKEYHGVISPGVVNSRLALEGPVLKDKCSFLLAGRWAYPNWVIKSLKNNDIINQRASFYDANAKLVFWLNDKNKISLFGYGSQDKIKLSQFATNQWQTVLGGFQWTGYLSDKVNLYFSANSTHYQSEILDIVSNYERSLTSETNVSSFKLSTNYAYKEDSHLKFGLGGNYYSLSPRNVTSKDVFGEVKSMGLEKTYALETNVFFEHELALSGRLSVNYGLRFSPYFSLGEGTVYHYSQGVPKSIETQIDSLYFAKNEIIKSYYGLAPRFSLRYLFSENASLKIGYNKMIQFLHLISNTATAQPFNIWQASNSSIEPINSHQLSIGGYWDLSDGMYKVSSEIYYKSLSNLLDYKNGANLIFNRHLETELLAGTGRAYGVEVKTEKNLGRLIGSIGYTYSRSLRKFKSNFKEETINNGVYYPANYDKPHDLTITGTYAFTRVYSMSFQFLYSTGRPFTGPTSKYIIGDPDTPIEVAHYSSRNEYRLPDYHRLDISFNFKKGHKKNQLMYTQWSLSVYNVYARKNAYSIFFQDKAEPKDPPFRAYKLSIIGIPVPSISCQIKF